MTGPSIPGWGPGVHMSLRLNGIDELTFAKLRAFVHDGEANQVPENAPVELHTEYPDRPGEHSTWSITVSWKEPPE